MMPFAFDLISTLVMGSILPVATTERTIVPRSTVASRESGIAGAGPRYADAAQATTARATTPSASTSRERLVLIIGLSDVRRLRNVSVAAANCQIQHETQAECYEPGVRIKMIPDPGVWHDSAGRRGRAHKSWCHRKDGHDKHGHGASIDGSIVTIAPVGPEEVLERELAPAQYP